MQQEIASTGFAVLPCLKDNFVNPAHKLRASFGWATGEIALPVKKGPAAGGTFSVAFSAHPDLRHGADLYALDPSIALVALGARDMLLVEIGGHLDIAANCLRARISHFEKDYRAQFAGQAMTQRHREVVFFVDAATLNFALDRMKLLETTSRLLISGWLQEAVVGLQRHLPISTLELEWCSEISDNCDPGKFHYPAKMAVSQGSQQPDGSLLFARLDV